MKILQQSSYELVIEEKPTGFLFVVFIIWGIMFMGIPLNMISIILTTQKNLNNLLPFSFLIIFPIIGFLVIFYVFQTHIFIFDKLQNLLIHQSKTFFGHQTQEYSLNDITGLQINKYRNKSGYYYKLELVGLSRKNIPINRLGGDPQKQVKKVAYILEDFLKVSLQNNS